MSLAGLSEQMSSTPQRLIKFVANQTVQSCRPLTSTFKRAYTTKPVRGPFPLGQLAIQSLPRYSAFPAQLTSPHLGQVGSATALTDSPINDKVRTTQQSSQLSNSSAEHKLTQAERDAAAIARMEARFGGGDQSMHGSHLDGTMGSETKRNMFRVI